MAPRHVTRGAAAYGVLAVSAMLLAGCSADPLEADQVEEKIGSALILQGVAKPKSIDCPEDLPAEEGATIECRIRMIDDTEHRVTVEATGVDGDDVETDVKVDPEPIN